MHPSAKPWTKAAWVFRRFLMESSSPSRSEISLDVLHKSIAEIVMKTVIIMITDSSYPNFQTTIDLSVFGRITKPSRPLVQKFKFLNWILELMFIYCWLSGLKFNHWHPQYKDVIKIMNYGSYMVSVYKKGKVIKNIIGFGPLPKSLSCKSYTK